MVDCIFHNRLQDHARQFCVFDAWIDHLFKMNIPCKPDVQDVDVVVHRLKLLLKERSSAVFAHVVPEKIRHLLDKNAGLLCIFHHCKLCARI